MQKNLPVLCGIAIALALASPALAQETLRVPVDGHAMRVQLGGQERMGKLPLVIFESGGGGWSVDGWRPVFTDIAKVAPVLAYDRAGYGQSVSDGQPPTPKHNAETLHRLLAVLELPPPYVLVGHSWGGPLIRMFAALYPAEVAGMVYLDPTDLHSREQELEHLRAIGYSADGAADYLTTYRRDFAAYIATLPPEVQVEMKLIDDMERRDAPEFQQLPPVPSVPVSIVLAGKRESWIWDGKPCQPDVCYERRLDFRQRWLARWTATANPGSIIIDTASGHVVPTDNPALVADEIRKVLSLTKAN
jgi:pimeloyl-ACP methyl ester carboxylesterase